MNNPEPFDPKKAKERPDKILMWEAYGPSRIQLTFDHESSVGPTQINDACGPLCVVSGDTDEESLANAQRIADLLNKHGIRRSSSRV